jgi:hypothetical protein
MKIPLSILAIVAVVLGLTYLFAPEPNPELIKARTDLPWQITVNPDGSSRVFDLELGSATLNDAQGKFGAAEGYAVFVRNQESSDLEAYFGDVHFGMLKAKVVVKLQASEEEKRAMIERAGTREASPTGDWKYKLSPAETTQLGERRLTAISYVPGSRGLDQAFFLDRFGKPSATLTENEEAQSWFYPDKGVSILIDNKGREVLEYVPPRDFVMPSGVTPYAE